MQRRQTRPRGPRGADALSGWTGMRSARPKHAPPAPSEVEVGGGGCLRSAGVAPARDPGRGGAQAAHLGRGRCSPRPAGGAAPPLRVPLRAAAQPAPLPGAPPLPAPGARRPRPLSPAPAAACLCCFLLLDRPPAARSPQIRPEPGESSPWGLHAPAAVRAPRGHAPASAGCKERRREGTGPSSSCSEPRCGGRGSRRAAAAEAAAAGGGGSDAAQGASAPRITGPGGAGSARGRPEGRCTGTASSRGAAGRRAPGSPAPVARGGARGLPGPQPRAAWRAPASRPLQARVPCASAPQAAARLLALPAVSAASSRSRRPGRPAAAPLWPD